MKIRLSRGRRLGLAALAVAVSALLLLARLRSTKAPFITLHARDATVTLLAAGRVIGEKSIPLSFLRAGRIAAELAQDGDLVPAGRNLMRLDNASEEAAVERKRAALAGAKINLEKLRTVDLREIQEKVRQAKATDVFAAGFFERQSELFARNAIPKIQLDQALRDRDLANAALASAENQLRSTETTLKSLAELQVAQAENDLRQAEIDLRETDLRAPLDGQVVEQLAHRGQFVGAGQAVMTFIPDSPRAHVEIHVDEASAGKLRVGQKAMISSPAFPGKGFPAEVERVGAIVDAQRGTFSLRLATERPEPGLLPESSVSAQVVIGEAKGVLLLEQRFLVREGGAFFAFTAAGRRARRVAVTAVDLGSGFFGITSGLRAGDPVLLPQGLADGMRIKLVPAIS